MHVDLVYYDEHAPYPPGRRKQKAAGRFILRTHIENNTPYRTSDLTAIVHAVARVVFTDRPNSGHDANDFTRLRIASGGTPTTRARFGRADGKADGYIWIKSAEATSADVVEQLLVMYAESKPGVRFDLRERTALLRRILKRTGKIELRRRRGGKR